MLTAPGPAAPASASASATGIHVGYLPIEVIQRMCGHLSSPKDLLSVALTCKQAQYLVQDPPVVARMLLNQGFRRRTMPDYEVVVSNLSSKVDESALLQFFADCGVVSMTTLPSTGNGFSTSQIGIRFNSAEGFRRALGRHGRFLGGRSLWVRPSTSERRRKNFNYIASAYGMASAVLFAWCGGLEQTVSETPMFRGRDVKFFIRLARKPPGVVRALMAFGARLEADHNATSSELPDPTVMDVDEEMETSPNGPPRVGNLRPLFAAIVSGQIEVLRELLLCGANPTLDDYAAINQALRKSDSEAAILLTTIPYNLQKLSGMKRVPYDRVGIFEHAACTALKLKQNDFFNELVDKHRTLLEAPIHLSQCVATAVEEKDYHSVCKLLACGAELLNTDGLEAIRIACKQNTRNICEVLVQKFNSELSKAFGTDSDWGLTALKDSRSVQLISSSYLNDADSVQRIMQAYQASLQAGPEPREDEDEEAIQDADHHLPTGPTAISIFAAAHAAARSGHADIVRHLLSDPTTGRNTATSFDFLTAAVAGGVDTVRAVIDSQVLRVFRLASGEIDGEDQLYVEHMLYCACGVGRSLEVAVYLMDYGARFTGRLNPGPREEPPTNRSVFWSFCAKGNLAFATALLAGKVYAPNSQRETTIQRFMFGTIGTAIDQTVRKIAPRFSLQVLGMFPPKEAYMSVWVTFEQFAEMVRDAPVGGQVQLEKLYWGRGGDAAGKLGLDFVGSMGIFIGDLMESLATDENFNNMVKGEREQMASVITCAAATVAVVKKKKLQLI
ncbi:hypothetical protein HDU96_007795 [Phlyctochytrium bullatum]|nr:hypothetical protein HDU96_007795 [Phlyctochytrium bullatum]